MEKCNETGEIIEKDFTVLTKITKLNRVNFNKYLVFNLNKNYVNINTEGSGWVMKGIIHFSLRRNVQLRCTKSYGSFMDYPNQAPGRYKIINICSKNNCLENSIIIHYALNIMKRSLLCIETT